MRSRTIISQVIALVTWVVCMFFWRDALGGLLVMHIGISLSDACLYFGEDETEKTKEV